eukprot:3409045-Rhodomonas_salina.3
MSQGDNTISGPSTGQVCSGLGSVLFVLHSHCLRMCYCRRYRKRTAHDSSPSTGKSRFAVSSSTTNPLGELFAVPRSLIHSKLPSSVLCSLSVSSCAGRSNLNSERRAVIPSRDCSQARSRTECRLGHSSVHHAAAVPGYKCTLTDWRARIPYVGSIV